MKKRILIGALALLSLTGMAFSQEGRRQEGTLVFQNVPAQATVSNPKLDQYANTRSAHLVDWDPSGDGLYIKTRFGQTSQLHQIHHAGGARKQLTFFKEPIGSVQINPHPDRPYALLLKDVGGAESYQVFLRNLKDGTTELLTDGKSRYGAVTWNHYGDRFAYYSTERNGKDWDIVVRDLEGVSHLFVMEGSWYPLEFSPDGQKLLVQKYISANHSELHVLDLPSGKKVQLSDPDNPASYGYCVFTPDSQKVLATSDIGGEFLELYQIDLKSSKWQKVRGLPQWSVQGVALAPYSNEPGVVLVNEDGTSRLFSLDLNQLNATPLPRLPMGEISSMSLHPSGTHLAYSFNGPQTPGDIYLLDLKNPSQPQQWTHSEVGGLDPKGFTEPELIHYPTFDKVDGKTRKIPAFYYQPKGEGPFPVVIYIHGGPESQYTPYFSSTLQYMIEELKIAVIAPNVRGSDGYGKTYLDLDNGYKREDSVKDIGSLIDWIAEQPELQKDKIAVFGGSYGGYMVLASLTHYSDKLAAGVDVVGISNFVTFLTNTKDYRRDLRRVEYGDERDPKMNAFLQEISPLNNAEKITKPLLIIQGANDPRVPLSEAEQMLTEIEEQDGVVWYLMAEDEGHGFRKKKNRDVYKSVLMNFLKKYLLES